MERYRQQFVGIGNMVKSDTGDWCKNEDFETLLEGNNNSLFDVIKERNADIEMHKQCIEELNVLISKVNRWREDDLKEHQSESMQNFEELQRLGDDLEYLKNWNTKLFSLLVMSTVFNFGAIAFFVFERIGMI
jgi:hypothetical protein